MWDDLRLPWQPYRRGRQLLARLSRSAYGSFLTVSARGGTDRKGSEESKAFDQAIGRASMRRGSGFPLSWG